MIQAKSYPLRPLICSLLFMSAHPAVGQPISHIAPHCEYRPDDPFFQAGDETVQHPLGHSGRPDEPGTTDEYDILLPRVNRPATRYSTGEKLIPLKRGDEVMIEACGCIQTGGTGHTWKRYVNPTGEKSDELYHGLILIPNAAALKLPSSPKMKNFVRLSDLMAAQSSRGFRLRITDDSFLTLGYEDDDYSDNGYLGHDDGNDDQCKNVGGAAVAVTIKHN